ncbi:MAG TPA: nucleotidyltransferase family protein [Myxococcales bacterium]
MPYDSSHEARGSPATTRGTSGRARRTRVRSLDLFGSIARGDSGADSDVDLLVEFDRPVGLFQFFRVQRRLEAIVGRPVDLVMKDAIKSQLRTRILAETVSAT